MREKSDENWTVGNTCLQNGQPNAAASRIYYAVFQVVYEFAQKFRSYQGKAGGVHADMTRVVGDVINDKKSSEQVYKRLKLLRETADYDLENVDDARLKALLPEADRLRQRFIEKCQMREVV